MSNVLDVNKDSMQSTIDALKKAATDVTAVKTNIESRTKTLLSGWKGLSKNAFEDEYYILSANLGEYSEILTDMANILNITKVKFEEADKTLSNKMNQE